MTLAKRAAEAFLVAALLGVVGCGDDDEPLTGVWTGGFRDSLGVLGGGDLTFTQSSPMLVGSWQVVFQNFPGTETYNNRGSLTGMAEGDSISALMTSSQGTCAFQLQATRSGRVIRGSYAAIDCAVAQTGTLDLERRP